jgi:cysteine desulfurase family protein
MSQPRIYLDNAATSWPKPEAVYRAVDRYQRELGAPAGRSAYAEAAEVGQAVDAARQGVAQLIGAKDARHLVFAFNGSDALNMALHGVLRPGDHVVTTVVEHNSVLRPLRDLEDRGLISVARVTCDAQGVVDAAAIRASLRPGTRLIALTHASNVTGALQPAADVAEIARQHGALVLLDAAQSLGHLPLSVADLPVDLLAAPGHKGLLGPLGTGILYVRPGVEEHLASLRQGGTGSRSEEDRQPEELPDKYESGNLNAPGILGLGAAVDWLHQCGLEAVRRHERELCGRLIEGLRDIAGIQLYGPCDPSRQVGVVSLTVPNLDPQETAAALDAACRIQVRSGLHCAPLMHRALGTLSAGGTVRLSLGPFNTSDEIDAAVVAVKEIAGA